MAAHIAQHAIALESAVKVNVKDFAYQTRMRWRICRYLPSAPSRQALGWWLRNGSWRPAPQSRHHTHALLMAYLTLHPTDDVAS